MYRPFRVDRSRPSCSRPGVVRTGDLGAEVSVPVHPPYISMAMVVAASNIMLARKTAGCLWAFVNTQKPTDVKTVGTS